MITETMFLIVTRYQLRNTYVNRSLLLSTYLCLQELTPIKGFPKCISIISNLQSGPKNIYAGFLRAGLTSNSGPRATLAPFQNCTFTLNHGVIEIVIVKPNVILYFKFIESSNYSLTGTFFY